LARSGGPASACGELFEAAFLDVGVDEGDDDGLILGAHGLHRLELQLELVVRSPLVGSSGEDAELESTGEDLLEPGAFEEAVEEHDEGLLVFIGELVDLGIELVKTVVSDHDGRLAEGLSADELVK